MCLDGNARHAIAHRPAQANKCLAKWRLVLNSSWLPRLMRLNVVKQCGRLFAGVRVSGRQSRHKETTFRAGVLPWMEMDQWRRHWHRTGHRWIEKCSTNVSTATRERVLCWACHVARMDFSEICAKALGWRGLQWWGWRQLHWKDVGHIVSKSAGGRTWYRRRYPKSVETQLAFCPQVGCSLLRIVGNGDSSFYLGKARPRRGHGDDTVKMHQLPREGPSAPGKLWDVLCWWLRLASNGGGGSEWLRLAPNAGCGFEWRRFASKNGHKWYKVRRQMMR